jgi:RNase adapter protein RapZ
MSNPMREIILVTGLSGAGKASILRVLEDLGFETVDNPPVAILESLVGDGVLPLAAGIDARTRDFDAAAVLRVSGTAAAALGHQRVTDFRYRGG